MACRQEERMPALLQRLHIFLSCMPELPTMHLLPKCPMLKLHCLVMQPGMEFQLTLQLAGGAAHQVCRV